MMPSISSFVRVGQDIYVVTKGVGRHRQGGLAPWPENSFILTIEATNNRG